MSGWQLPYQSSDLATRSYAAIALYILGLFLGKRLLRRRLRGLNYLTFFTPALSISTKSVVLLVVATFRLRLLIRFKYGMFFSGDHTLDRVLSLPYALVVAQMVAAFMEVAAQVWAAATLAVDAGLKRKLCALMVLLIELFVAFIQGRRWIFGLGLLFALCTVMFNSRCRAFSLRKKIIAFGFMAVCIGLLPIFSSLRQTYQSDHGRGNPINRLMSSADTLSGHTSWQSSLTENDENMAVRLDYIAPIADLITTQRYMPYMYGWATLYSILYSFTRAIYPSKSVIPKTMVALHYNTMYTDWSNTMVAYGVADWGLAGAFLIGAMLSFFMGLSEVWLMRSFRGPKLVAVAAAGNLFYMAYNIESDPSCLWNFLKILAVLFCAWKALSLLKTRTIRNTLNTEARR